MVSPTGILPATRPRPGALLTAPRRRATIAPTRTQRRRRRPRPSELERMVREPGSQYYAKSAKQAAAILEDPDEYRAVGAFIVRRRGG